MRERDSKERLRDMLEAISKIERLSKAGREAFEDEDLVQTSIIHNLQVLGEAAARLDADFRRAHSVLPWKRIVQLRNEIVQECFGIDPSRVWQTVERDIPGFKKALEALLAGLEGEP